VGVEGTDYCETVLQQLLMLFVSAGTIFQNWRMKLVKLLILLPISLEAQLRNQHLTYTSRR